MENCNLGAVATTQIALHAAKRPFTVDCPLKQPLIFESKRHFFHFSAKKNKLKKMLRHTNSEGGFPPFFWRGENKREDEMQTES